MVNNERWLNLKTGPFTWQPRFDREKRRLFILGVAGTEVSNILAWQGISLGLKRPLLRFVRCFSPKPE